MERIEESRWNEFITQLPGPHILQTRQWAKAKAQNGWQPVYLAWKSPTNSAPLAGALVLQRTIAPGGFAARMRILYAPKGPILDWENQPLRQQVLQDLGAFARKQGAIFLKLDPDVRLGTGMPGDEDFVPHPTGNAVLDELKQSGWLFSSEQIQFRNTVLLDICGEEEELLARMKQKTRYNIRLAERKGVNIRPGTEKDFPLLYKMYAETSIRDGFVIRSQAYYQNTWQVFINDNLAKILIAEVDGQPVAGLILFLFQKKAWYLFGMSSEAHREKMPNYLLQWAAIRLAKANACQEYDLWGAPDQFSETDRMWGVYRFKEGLGGQVVCHIGAWDLPIQPLLYRLYMQYLPKILDWMRTRGKEQTRRTFTTQP